MNLNRIRAFLVLAAGPLCYLSKLPYVFRAWNSSPMDKLDWITLPAALLAAFFTLKGSKERLADPFVPVRMLPFGAALALFAAAQLVSINTLALLAAVAVWWCSCFAALTPGCAFALLPAFLLLCLGCTSSTYWIGYLLSVSTSLVWIIKGLAAAGILTLAAFRITIRAEILAFIACSAVGLFCWNNADTLSRTSDALILDMKRSPAGCIVRELPPGYSAKRFFRNSSVRSFLIADDNGSCNLLEIRKVGNIHEVHPAGHCLRSSGRRIVSERTEKLKIGSRLIPVTLILTRGHDGRELFAVWYTTPGFSCSSFLAFRRQWLTTEKWRIYQISIPLEELTPEDEGIRRLESVISRFAVK